MIMNYASSFNLFIFIICSSELGDSLNLNSILLVSESNFL